MKKFLALIVVLALFAGIFAGSVTMSGARAETTGFDDIRVLDATVADDLVVSDDATVSGDLSVVGASNLRQAIMAAKAFTATAGYSIDGAYSSYIVSSSSAVSVTLAACANNGQLIYLYGDDNYTVTINDTNLLSSDGNAITFGQYDLVALQCFGGKWSLVAKSANQ